MKVFSKELGKITSEEMMKRKFEDVQE